MNHLIFIKKQLYILKRQYGQPIDFYEANENGGPNLSTGIRTPTRIRHHIKKAIVMPISLVSEGTYNQAFMKNIGREYAYGNILTLEMKTIIIDQKDIPLNYNITTDNYIIFNHNRYEVMKVEKLEQNFGYSIIVKRLTGVPKNEVFELSINQNIRFIERQLCQ